MKVCVRAGAETMLLLQYVQAIVGLNLLLADNVSGAWFGGSKPVHPLHVTLARHHLHTILPLACETKITGTCMMACWCHQCSGKHAPYIYIYVVVLLSGPSLAFWGVIIWAKFLFFYKTLFVKNTINARKFEVLLSGPSWPFLSCSQLGPDNNTYLAQIITPQNGFFQFFVFKMCQNTNFYSVFEHQPKLDKKGAKKTITFHILQNTGW